MKRLAVLTIMVVMMGIPGIAKADYLNYYFGGRWYDSGYGRRGYGHYRSQPVIGVGVGYNGYYDGYYGGYYGNENVNVRYRERWDVQGGERSFEQSPNIEGKLIDAATRLSALLIFSH